MRLLKFIAAAAIAFGLARPVAAQTIDEILTKGQINIGVLIDVPPYGTVNANQEPDGYDADVAKLMGKYLGVKVNLIPLTGPNRIPYLVTGKVDLLIATFGITPERAKQVMFSIPYSAIENSVFARTDSGIKSTADLKGKKVGVPRGSVQDVLLTNALGTSAKIQRFDDDASTYQALASGQVDAIAETGFTGRELYAKSPDLKIGEAFILLRQPNGITMRKDQYNLLRWVNTFVYYTKNNGELAAIWTKWFKTDFPTLPTF
ncbi:MAG: transporter substrate-binding domain-containing protein [Acetobacteraceae bacterium]|nr:transporter substrate-binding domain-containing protein [Acetobacteraceae bacterium]